MDGAVTSRFQAWVPVPVRLIDDVAEILATALPSGKGTEQDAGLVISLPLLQEKSVPRILP